MHSPSLRLSPAPDQNFSPPTPPPGPIPPPLPPLPPAFTPLTRWCRRHRPGLHVSDQTPPPTEAPINSSVVARIFRGRLNHPDDAKLLSRLLKPAFRGLEKAFLPSLSLSSLVLLLSISNPLPSLPLSSLLLSFSSLPPTLHVMGYHG